ncbi:MAG: MATE family efflux transporter [Myxococcota bacterium]
MTVGLLSMMTKNLVDTYFVGQLGTNELSAIGFTFPVILLMMSVTIGLGAGAASVVSRVAGAGDVRMLKRRSTDALVLAFVVVSFASGLGVATCRPLFQLLGAEGIILTRVLQYMLPWYLGLLVLVLPMVGNSLLRAGGEGVLPGLIMVFSAALNAVFDPIFIFGWWGVPAMGIAGASVATVISNFFASLASLWMIVRRDMLSVSVPRLSEVWMSWKQLLVIGVPAALTNMINPAGLLVVTALLASVSAEAVAAFGVASRLESLSAILLLSLSAAIGPMVGQNYGARRLDRVERSLHVAFQLCLASGLAAALVLAMAGPYVTPLFDDSAEVQRIANTYLFIVPVTLAGYGINIVVAAAFNALGRPLTASSMTIGRMFGVYVPLAFMLVQWTDLGATAVFVGGAAANIAGGVLGGLATQGLRRRLGSRFEAAATA